MPGGRALGEATHRSHTVDEKQSSNDVDGGHKQKDGKKDVSS